jgi:hypothetical protein
MRHIASKVFECRGATRRMRVYVFRKSGCSRRDSIDYTKLAFEMDLNTAKATCLGNEVAIDIRVEFLQ